MLFSVFNEMHASLGEETNIKESVVGDLALNTKKDESGSDNPGRGSLDAQFYVEGIDTEKKKPRDRNNNRQSDKDPLVDGHKINQKPGLKPPSNGEGEELTENKDNSNTKESISAAVPVKDSPESACHGHSMELSQECCDNLFARYMSQRVVVFQYPNEKEEPLQKTQKQSHAVFVRVDYDKDGTKMNHGVRPLKIEPFHVAFRRVPEEQIKGNLAKTLEDGGLISGVPLVDLGFRCDSREFIEQQGIVSSQKGSTNTKIVPRPKSVDSLRGVRHNNFRPLPTRSGKSLKLRNETVKMTRIDYKKALKLERGAASCLSDEDGSSVRKPTFKGERAENKAKPQEISTQSSDSCVPEKPEVEASSKGDDADPSLAQGAQRELSQVKNLPANTVFIKETVDSSGASHFEKVLKYFAKRINDSKIRCHRCGAIVSGDSLANQLLISSKKWAKCE